MARNNVSDADEQLVDKLVAASKEGNSADSASRVIDLREEILFRLRNRANEKKPLASIGWGSSIQPL